MVLFNLLLYAGMKKAEVRKNRLRTVGSRSRSTSIVSTSEIIIMGTVGTDLQIGRKRNRW